MVNSYGNSQQKPNRSVQKANADQIRVQFNDEYTEALDYEDKIPEGMTEEDVMKKYGKVVWCEFTDCFWNTREKDLQVTWGKVIGNKNFDPISPREMLWNGICNRPNEIVLRYRSIRSHSGDRVHVPYCYTSAKNGKTGHMDFASLLQGDGTPFGGSMESQAAGDHAFGTPSSFSPGRERIVNYGGQESASRPTKDYEV